MTGECGAFTCLLKLSNACFCSVRGCDAISCAYPVVAKNISDIANTAAARILIAVIGENAEVARTTAHPDASDLKPLDMGKLLKTSRKLFLPVSNFTTSLHCISKPSLHLNDRR